MVEKVIYDEPSNRCSRLKNCCISLEIKIQQYKESFQNNKSCQNQDALAFPEFFEINELKAKLQRKDTSTSNLKEHIATFKAKSVSDCDVQVNNSHVITPGIDKLDLPPLSLKLKRNREVHVDYLQKVKEDADTLREIVKEAKALKPLDNALEYDCGKDRPPMLALNPPYKFKWTEKNVPVAEGNSETTTEGYMENYKNVSQDIRNQLDAEAKAVQIILTGIYNDIYYTVDACPNACEIWKAIKRVKQGELINVHDFETNSYWEFGKFTSRDGESLESYYSRFYKMMNELITIVNSPPPTYDQEPKMVAEDDTLSKEKEIYKLMALFSLSFNKIYKPTNNNLRTSSSTNRAHQDNTLRINKGTGYDHQRVVNVDGARENVDHELEAHYPYMAKIQEVTPDSADNSGPIFDTESLQKEISTNGEMVHQDDDDLAKERDLFASLVEKLKCEIDDNKNHNKFLESSNKTLTNKLK
nr:hypothetical protein [Tanacetum cinerariifolium]